MRWTIKFLSPQDFSARVPALVDIYLEAMDYPFELRKSRIELWRHSVHNTGFTCVVAEEVNTGEELGFMYGAFGSPIQWWFQQIVRGMNADGGPTPSQWEILDSYFEITEFHVTPSCQGHGIGSALLQSLMLVLPTRYAMLSTPEIYHESNAAFHLYRNRGFKDVLRNFCFDGDNRPFAVLAADVAESIRLGTHTNDSD